MLSIYLIIGLIIGFFVGWVAKGRVSPSATPTPSNSPSGRGRMDEGLSEAEEKKQENIGKIKSYLSDHSTITNAEIAKLLGVSDATVVRYMDELEKEGIVKQVGKTGIDAHYEKV